MTPEQIAAELSGAQRRVLIGTLHPLRRRAYAQVAAALRRKGLFVRAGDCRDLNDYTPLGLAVRAILEKADG